MATGLMEKPVEKEEAAAWIQEGDAMEGADEEGEGKEDGKGEGDDDDDEGGGGGCSSKDIYVPDVRQTRAMAEGGLSSRGHRAPTHLYIIVHNIESPALRRKEAQQALARLASAPGIMLAATIDDVNACLMWDPVLRSTFNFVSADLTTFARYVHEAPYASGGGTGTKHHSRVVHIAPFCAAGDHESEDFLGWKVNIDGIIHVFLWAKHFFSQELLRRIRREAHSL